METDHGEFTDVVQSIALKTNEDVQREMASCIKRKANEIAQRSGGLFSELTAKKIRNGILSGILHAQHELFCTEQRVSPYNSTNDVDTDLFGRNSFEQQNEAPGVNEEKEQREKQPQQQLEEDQRKKKEQL